MAIIRVEKNKNYTAMSNEHLRNKNLSLKAKGLLSMMLSLPDEWEYSVNGLVAICQEGKASVKSTLKELKDNGYLKVEKLTPDKTKNGRIGYVYIIFENRKQEPGFQPLEFQPLENQPQLNTNILNTNIYNTNNTTNNSNTNNTNNNIQKKKEKKLKKEKRKIDLEDEFETLWKLYPNKQGKINARKSFIKHRQSGVEYQTIEKGLKRYVDYCKTIKDKKYIKHGSTWFNQMCWEDDYTVSSNSKMMSHNYDVDELEKQLLSKNNKTKSNT